MAAAAPKLQSGQSDESTWRSSSLRASLHIAALIGSIWLAVVFATTPGTMTSVFGIVDMTLIASVWIVSTLPFSDKVRFAVVETVFFGASVNSILVYGTAPSVPVLLGLFVLLAAVHHGARGGIIAGAASLLLLVLAGWGWTAGALPVGPRFPALVPSQHDLWTRTMFAQLMAACVVTAIIAAVINEMQALISRIALAEEKFAKAFSVCPDAMIITELESGRFLEVNDSHGHLTGYSREEVLGRTSIEIGSFADARDRDEFAAPLKATGSARHKMRKIRDRNGREIEVVYSAECFDLAGVTCVLTIIQDFTERRKVESDLKANEERFRGFIENANVGIYRSTPDGHIVMANPALLRILGYRSFEELQAHNLESDKYEAGYSRSEFRKRIERAGMLAGLEASWVRRDGKTIFVRESATVVREPDGSVLYYDGIIEDISERRKAEQDLRESEERFRNLTEAAFEGIVISEKGRVLDINDQGLRMFGYERAEMIGRSVVEFVSPESRPTVEEAISAGRELTYEHQLVRKDGSRFHAEARAKMMSAGDRMVRMTALRDVTERREAERRQRSLEEQISQMQKMEALGTLAGGIAHDFNNILTGILGNLQLAEMELDASHPASAPLLAADQASRRARELVARILSFSRFESGSRETAPLGPIVLEAVQLLRAGLPQEIEIKVRIDSRCPTVAFDSGQIHQVIMNLGTNSIHALGSRGGILELELREVAPTGAIRERHTQVLPSHTVCLTMRDNGCGMEEAVMKRMFEPFFTTKAFGQGTGLGLAMVHTVMKSHSGAIVVESSPGSGTKFDLYFPAAQARPVAPKPALPGKLQDRLAPFGNGRKVMLVDDDTTVRTVGTILLKRLGFEVAAFDGAAEAVRALAKAPAAYAAIISDLAMPGMDGLELASQAQTISPGVPVVLTSGNLHPDARRKATESGVRCLISKPFEAKELAAQIRSLLDGA